MRSFVTTTVLFNIVPTKNEESVISQNQLSNSLLIEGHVLQLQTLNHTCHFAICGHQHIPLEWERDGR